MIEAESRRERRASARRYDQTWFDSGQRSAALAFVRGRIGRARFYVLVADPLFGPPQILQFLHAVPRVDVTITILTSRLAFESEGDDHSEAELPGRKAPSSRSPSQSRRRSPRIQDSKAHRIDDFRSAMRTFEKRGIKNAEAFVLTARPPALHDCFLVIDDVVWSLGNSLKALGDSASLILQVPDSEPVLKQLERLKAQATSFDTYAEPRREALSSRNKEG